MSPKLMLVILSLMFLIPLTIAWLMHSGLIDYSPVSGVNHGQLIDPPVAAELPPEYKEQGLDKLWVLAHFPSAYCEETCRERLYGLRQLHRALGRDAIRVRVVLFGELPDFDLTTSEFDLSEQDFTHIGTNAGKLSQQFTALGDKDGIFIIDPLSNIMMRYAPEMDPNDILVDMERLLKYQKTDPQ